MAQGLLAQRMETIAADFDLHCAQAIAAFEQGMQLQRIQFDQAADELDTALDALEANLAAPPEDIAEDLQEIAGKSNDHMHKLSELFDSVDQLTVHNRASSTDHAALVVELAGQLDFALTSAIAASAEQATAATQQLADWASETDAAVAVIDSAVQTLTDVVSNVNTAHEAGCAHLAELCQQLETTLAQTLGALSSRWEADLDRMAAGTEQLLLEHVGAMLQSDVGSAMGQLDQLRQNASQFSNALGEDALRLIGTMRQVLDLIAQIKPLIELVRELA